MLPLRLTPRPVARAAAALLPAAAAVLVPKCPFCLAALLASVGVGLPLQPLSMPGLAAGLLASSLGLILFGALRRRDPRPVVLGLAGGSMTLAGKLALLPRPALWIGIALLALAAVSVSPPTPAPCHHCKFN